MNIDPNEIDLIQVVRSTLGISKIESKCHCRPNSPDTCEYCTDMKTGEKFVDKEMKTVDLIASGYEWECPDCERLNKEIGVTETVTCSECDRTYKVDAAEHAYS